jgi:hypothetical protein
VCVCVLVGCVWTEQGECLPLTEGKVMHWCVVQGASFPATVFNLVNVIMGAGYVSIPFACK